LLLLVAKIRAEFLGNARLPNLKLSQVSPQTSGCSKFNTSQTTISEIFISVKKLFPIE